MRYYKRIDSTGKTTTVESYSHDLDIGGAVEIDKTEFDAYLSSLPKPVPVPSRDFLKEIDELKMRVEKLERR